MITLEKRFCENQACEDYGLVNHGNIAIRAMYGKNNDRPLLYCRSCGRTFAATRNTAFFGLRLPFGDIINIISHAAEGVGVRATSRLLGFPASTVNRIIVKVGEHCERVLTNVIRSINLTEVQLDELWTFCRKKSAEGLEDLEAGFGEKWIWSAIDVPTRLLLCTWIGGRELEDAREYFKKLIPIIKSDESGGIPLFTSDELPHYAAVLREGFHHLEPVPPTGKPGRPANPKVVIEPDLTYGTVKKTRVKGKVVEVRRKLVFGTGEAMADKLADSPSNTINTSFIERSNGLWRLWDAHLARKSPLFAKSIRWLKAKLAICVATYNFIRPHGTLSGKKGFGKPTTPAMAGKLADRPWEYSDILWFPAFC